MAIIKMSGVGITEAAGKVGGSVFSRSKSGLSVRSGKQKLKGRSQGAINQSGRLAFLQQRYKALTIQQKQSWESAAREGWFEFKNKLGEPMEITGLFLFERINWYRGIGALPYLARPVRPQAFPIFSTAFTLLRQTATQTLLMTTSTLNVNPTFQRIIFATPPMSAGASSPRGFKYLGIFNGTTSVNFGTQYAAVFGRALVGSRIFIKVIYTGRLDGSQHEMMIASRICTV